MSVLKKITAEAKRIRKAHPRTAWKSAVKQAGAKYRNGTIGKVSRKTVGKKKVGGKKRVGAAKLLERRETSRTKARVYRVVRSKAGRFKGTKRIAGVKRVKRVRRRVAGKGGGLMIPLLIGAAVVGAAILFTRESGSNQNQLPPGAPPLANTNNPVRNQQANNIVSYAMAGGLAIDAIIRLIQALNQKNDADISNIYDTLDSGGGLPPNLYV
jgi:hypothetical protein